MKNPWRTVRSFSTLWLIGLFRLFWTLCFCSADNSSRIFEGRKWDFLLFRLRQITNEIMEMAISNSNVRKPNSLFAVFAHCWAESALRQDKKQEKTKINSLWQLEKRKNPFRVVERMLTRKNFRLWFCSFSTTFCILTPTKREQKGLCNA